MGNHFQSVEEAFGSNESSNIQRLREKDARFNARRNIRSREEVYGSKIGSYSQQMDRSQYYSIEEPMRAPQNRPQQQYIIDKRGNAVDPIDYMFDSSKDRAKIFNKIRNKNKKKVVLPNGEHITEFVYERKLKEREERAFSGDVMDAMPSFALDYRNYNEYSQHHHHQQRQHVEKPAEENRQQNIKSTTTCTTCSRCAACVENNKSGETSETGEATAYSLWDYISYATSYLPTLYYPTQETVNDHDDATSIVTTDSYDLNLMGSHGSSDTSVSSKESNRFQKQQLNVKSSSTSSTSSPTSPSSPSPYYNKDSTDFIFNSKITQKEDETQNAKNSFKLKLKKKLRKVSSSFEDSSISPQSHNSPNSPKSPNFSKSLKSPKKLYFADVEPAEYNRQYHPNYRIPSSSSKNHLKC
ncbi:hypothetical protein PACTADRAFT_52075 [Pachysolen tannophilus NRRL Y-2460]|uniref:Uncharacterized protein n=1 Tax=Pachysolen tannophilus NRRL Y-2460 TaxID=669874 RepID=A0A1E4TP97_PACTA|nr:hypothetical protein PACTADRAFT_52075 [Pachysolen tannophilus NRRL Y-2460]